MKRSSTAVKPCALLWDESFLWGIMSFNALKSARLPFDVVRSEDIRGGVLNGYGMLFVPGGWASNKIKSLGDNGVHEIRKFVEGGGNYLGFCGGAGLATLDGIGLLNISRIPTKSRVPSYSGKSEFRIVGHPMWTGFSGKHPIFHVWWPSQFSISGDDISVLAAYDGPCDDSFSSDLNVGDVRKLVGNWDSLEKAYGINLDPERLRNQPAVVEGRCGKGRVLLSLVHFDTPDDKDGARVLKNIWRLLAGEGSPERSDSPISALRPSSCEGCRSDDLDKLKIAAEELISFGERNFLWFWRNPLLIQWRRGIRGLEYCTLYGMIKAISKHLDRIPADEPSLQGQIGDVLELLLTFKEKAQKLLLLERNSLQDGLRITYEKSDNPEIVQLRSELFSTSKSYGGMFKQLLDRIDSLLYPLLKNV